MRFDAPPAVALAAARRARDAPVHALDDPVELFLVRAPLRVLCAEPQLPLAKEGDGARGGAKDDHPDVVLMVDEPGVVRDACVGQVHRDEHIRGA